HEISGFTAQLSIRAAADGVPVIRLPGAVNSAREQARKLATLVRRSPSPNQLLKANRFSPTNCPSRYTTRRPQCSEKQFPSPDRESKSWRIRHLNGCASARFR